VPFTLRNIKEDLEDVGHRFDGPPDLEFRAAAAQIRAEPRRSRMRGACWARVRLADGG
jgi:hypothetical protein